MRASHNVFSTLLPPWPGTLHPRAGDYRRAAATALLDVGLIHGSPGERATRRFESTVILDAHVYPHALDVERLFAVGMFSQWLFFLDDEYDDHPTFGRDAVAVRSLMTRAFTVLSRGSAPSSATSFLRFTAEMRRRLDALAPAGWTTRFLANVEDYLFRGSLRAVEYWSRDEVPSLGEYLRVRRLDSAVFPALDMSEIAGGLCLPDAVRAHPLLVEMKDLAVRYIAYVNDIFSYQKEVLVAGTSFNLVRVLMHANDSSFEEGVEAAACIVGAALARFSEIEASLPVWDAVVAPEVAAYIAGMKSWIRGSFDFSLASARYSAHDSPFPELRGVPIQAMIPESACVESSRGRGRDARRRTITLPGGYEISTSGAPPVPWSLAQALDDAPRSSRRSPPSVRSALEGHRLTPTPP